MITRSIKIVKLFKESCPVRLCMCSSAEVALPFLHHCSTGPDLRAAMAQQLATVESGIWDALWKRLAAIASGIVGYQGLSEKMVLLKISVSVGHFKSQFQIVARKKEKLVQLVMLDIMQTEKNAVAAPRAESLPALRQDQRASPQMQSFPMQWTNKFNWERDHRSCSSEALHLTESTQPHLSISF